MESDRPAALGTSDGEVRPNVAAAGDGPATIAAAARRLRFAAAIVFFATAGAVVATLPDFGMAIDEATYVWVAEEERRWFVEWPERGWESVTREGLARRWHFLEDPAARAADRHSNFNLPFACHWMNVGWLASRWFVDELTAHRMGNVLLFAACVAAVFWSVGRRYGATAGLVAAAGVVLTPRVFAHAHFAATDTPLAVCWTVALLAIARFEDQRFASDSSPAPRGGWWPVVVAAVLVGLVLSNKLTGWLLIVPTGLWLIAYRPVGWRQLLALLLVIPFLLVILLTPPLWHEPIAGLLRYLRSAASNPWQIPSYYLGAGYTDDLPWTSGPVLVAVTTPISLLVLSMVGACAALKDRWSALFLWNAAFLLFMRTIGKMPQHDVERQFLPYFYFAAVLAGCGTAWLGRWVGRGFRLARRSSGVQRAARCVGVLLALALLAEPAVESFVYGRHALSYYNRLIGGLPGARRHGFETSYWFESATHDVWRELCERLPPGARVFFRPDHPGLEFLQRQGLWRDDLRSVGPEEADYFLLTGRRAAYLVRDPDTGRFEPTDLLEVFETAPADVEVRFLGVRLLALVPVRRIAR